MADAGVALVGVAKQVAQELAHQRPDLDGAMTNEEGVQRCEQISTERVGCPHHSLLTTTASTSTTSARVERRRKRMGSSTSRHAQAADQETDMMLRLAGDVH